MNAQEIIDEAVMLPIEQRAMLADVLLDSINSKDNENQTMWIEVAKNRLKDLEHDVANSTDSIDVLRGAWSRVDK